MPDKNHRPDSHRFWLKCSGTESWCKARVNQVLGVCELLVLSFPQGLACHGKEWCHTHSEHDWNDKTPRVQHLLLCSCPVHLLVSVNNLGDLGEMNTWAPRSSCGCASNFGCVAAEVCSWPDSKSWVCSWSCSSSKSGWYWPQLWNAASAAAK